MKKKITSMLAGIAFCAAANAQLVVHQVLFANQGWYDYTSHTQMIPPTIGTYNPVSKVYTIVDTIKHVHFTSDILVNNSDNCFYVAADTLLLKYDLNTYQVLAQKTVKGIRNLALWNSQLLISRGDTIPMKSYFQVYDANSLGFIYELDTNQGPKYASAGMTIYNDTAYLAINDFAVQPIGKIGIINLQAQNYKAEVDLGINGVNPENVMRTGGVVYTLNNNPSFTSSSITAFNASDRSNNTVLVSNSTSCGTSTKALNFVYYQTYASNTIQRFDVSTMVPYDTLKTQIQYYGMLDDSINNKMYITATDYFSYGKAYIMSYTGAAIDSFAVGVNPGNMALDVRNTLGVPQVVSPVSLNVYPNPASSIVNITIGGSLSLQKVTLTDALGKTVYQKLMNNSERAMELNVEGYSNGIYFLTIQISDGTLFHNKIVKQ